MVRHGPYGLLYKLMQNYFVIYITVHLCKELQTLWLMFILIWSLPFFTGLLLFVSDCVCVEKKEIMAKNHKVS